MTTAENISKNLRDARKEAKKSINDVIQSFAIEGRSISHQTLINHERGRSVPAADVLELYARVYELPVEFFFDVNHS